MENKENMVTVTLEQYKSGIEAAAIMRAMAAYLNYKKYTVDRDVIAAMLGIDLEEEGENENE